MTMSSYTVGPCRWGDPVAKRLLTMSKYQAGLTAASVAAGVEQDVHLCLLLLGNPLEVVEGAQKDCSKMVSSAVGVGVGVVEPVAALARPKKRSSSVG